MKKLFAVLFLLFFLWACSGTDDCKKHSREAEQMHRLCQQAQMLSEYDKTQLERTLKAEMPKMDSASSPVDWFRLRTLRLISEKNLYKRYVEASENIEFFKKKGMTIDIGRNYEILGNVFYELNDREQSLEYYSEAEKMYRRCGATRNLAIMEIGRASALGGDEELEVLHRLLRDSVVNSNPLLRQAVLQNAYIMLDSAALLHESIDIMNEYSPDNSQMGGLLACRAYELLVNDSIAEALRMMPAVDSAIARNNPPSRQMEFIHAVKSEIYDAAGMKDSCIEALDWVVWWTDSTLRQANAPQVYAAETLKHIDIVETKSRLERQRIVLLWVISLLLILIIATSIYYCMQRQRHKRELELKEMEEKIQGVFDMKMAQASILSQNEKMLRQIKEMIESGNDKMTSHKEIVDQILRLINIYLSGNDNRNNLLKLNDELDSGFMHRLKQQHPNLTESQLRLASLIAIGIDSQQLASTLNISAKSLYTSRYRLRSAMNLTKEDSLEEYLRSFKNTPH